MEVRLEDGSSRVADAFYSSDGFRWVRDSDGNEQLATTTRAPMGTFLTEARLVGGEALLIVSGVF